MNKELALQLFRKNRRCSAPSRIRESTEKEGRVAFRGGIARLSTAFTNSRSVDKLPKKQALELFTLAPIPFDIMEKT